MNSEDKTTRTNQSAYHPLLYQAMRLSALRCRINSRELCQVARTAITIIRHQTVSFAYHHPH